MFTNVYLFVKSFFKKIGKDRVYNYSASSAFFIILSIFPFLILTATLIKYTPLTEEFVLARFEFLLPDAIFPLIRQITEEIFSSTSGTTLILVSALGVIWSASKGVMSIIRGINVCFNINDKRNWVRLRLLSCLYTVVFIVAFVIILILLVFGSLLYNTLSGYLVTISRFLSVVLFILRRRVIIALVILTFLFMLIYSRFPASKNKYFQMFPGAILAAGAFVGLSELLSVYVKYSPSFSYTYGSLTTFILLMLYLYFGMYIIFICAEINFYFKSWLQTEAAKRKRRKAMKYESSVERKHEKYETKKLRKEEKEELKRLLGETKEYRHRQ
ncbi:MAG: YihY/virulence factor BrkB family protein [Lachnospiraceae bacterium]|nr:YihY/virulence factor BrkB family protein [Lachnospiraceae bacterium]